MALNPVFLKLIRQTADDYDPEKHLRREVRFQVNKHRNRISKARSDLFNQSYLPRISVLAQLMRQDREAVIAHYRAKELRNVADSMHEGNYRTLGLARKRLERVNELANTFAEVDQERRLT
ncbi:hypothetical protein KY389_09810 [Paracoccus bogoriensis]|uniref:hypothetical protein n=1 Tax=Paracoccus bogoriensis TaxID=242065 RepID=UPI001CA56B18|nr:hypothetical protein [Paracoccus bogoriensis]MBW7056987.1 hypothetical protein [Paracoccus bogoriensis]